MQAQDRSRRVILGRVSGVYGIRGWIKVFSETVPRENILEYPTWYLGNGKTPRRLAEGRPHGKGVIARLEGCEDRDQAAALIDQQIAVRRDQLPPPSADELYWTDLEGLAVETQGGRSLGRVDHLIATAGNDVLVVKGERERLIPLLWDDVIKAVDFERELIEVDWDPDF
jgi:16S rRNA processing protein RimM